MRKDKKTLEGKAHKPITTIVVTSPVTEEEQRLFMEDLFWEEKK